MSEINNINSIAREIVSNLDKQDGKEDGKIEASIWNKFVCKKQGNEIHNYINTNSAVKSVIAYLKREVAKTGQAIEDVANEWLKNVGGGDKTEIDENRYNKSENDLTMKPVIIEEYDKTWNGKEIDKKHKQKIQQAADKAIQLLMDVANKNYRYNIVSEPNGDEYQDRWIDLKDGRHIDVILKEQENGKYKIDFINIAGNKNDDYCLVYDSNKDRIRTHCDAFAGNTSDANTIESLLKLVQKIFGDDIEV